MIRIVLLLATLAPTSPADTKTRVDEIFRDYDRSDSPGCALGVYKDGRIEYARGYGMANLELGVANSPQTVFDIGSTSKQFAAFAIHLLAADGKLNLDDDIRKWVPEVPDYGKTITIRQLLHHTSGLRDYLTILDLAGVRDEDLATEADALAAISRQKALNFEPGAEHLYSNTGYFLLSVIVKRASGKSLRDFAAEWIFGPLGMRHTQFNDSHTRIVPNRATGYSKEKAGGVGISMSDFEQVGDGSVWTTVEDLLLWDRNFYDPKVGDRGLLEAMQTVGVLNNGKKLEYASGLRVATDRGLASVSHGGAWVGYRAQLLRFPGQKLSVACLCNLAQSNPSAFARRVAEVYLGDRMEPAKKAQARTSAKIAVPPAALSGYSGAYRDPKTGDLVKVVAEGGKLFAQSGSRRRELEPVSAGRFRAAGMSEGIERRVDFEASPSGGRPRARVTDVWEGDEEETAVYDPVELWSPSAGDLAAFAGSYTSDEILTTWRIVLEGGKLYLRYRTAPEAPLEPTITGSFAVEGMNIVFSGDGSRRVTGFTLDRGRVRGIAFRRVPETAVG